MSAPSAVQLTRQRRNGAVGAPYVVGCDGSHGGERHRSAQFLSRQVDENGLEAQLGDREKSRIENPPRSAAVTILGTRRSLPFTWSCRAPSTVRARVMSSRATLRSSPRASGRSNGLNRDDRVGSHALF